MPVSLWRYELKDVARNNRIENIYVRCACGVKFTIVA